MLIWKTAPNDDDLKYDWLLPGLMLNAYPLLHPSLQAAKTDLIFLVFSLYNQLCFLLITTIIPNVVCN